jgi:hypothetical protein
MKPRLPRKPRVPALVVATAVGVGCGGKQRAPQHDDIRIGPPSCVPQDTTRTVVQDEQNQPLPNVAIHVKAGEQEQILTSGPNGAFDLPAQVSDETQITAPGFEIVTRSSGASCHSGPQLLLVLRPSPP